MATAVAHETRSLLNATGTVSPDISRSVPVISIATGRVVEIHARLGDVVKKGQVLLRVQSADMSGAFSDYRKAVADEQLARTQLERAQLLYGKGAISLNDLQVAQDAAAKAKVDVENTTERLPVLGGSMDHPAAIVDIRAPVSGVITDQQVTNAAGVAGLGSPNPFTISDLSHIWVVCDVYENDLANVHLGESAEIRLNAYPDKVFTGRISNVGPVLDPTLRTAKVRIELRNPGLMRVGMFVTATFHRQKKETHTLFPPTPILHLDILTQWPGISAEQIEQQVTIPLEVVMNGIPHVVHLRSFSLFGLSDVKLIFDDEEENAWNRERVLERLSQVTLPAGVVPQMGTDWSPVGQIYFFTLKSTNPNYDVMELKSIEDWVVEKNFKAVPDIVDVASFGGPTREYQVRVDPNKLIAYGLSLAQVGQQLTNNNANAGGSFIEAGLQQINIREVGLVRNVPDIANTVIMTKSGTPLRVKDIAVVSQAPKIRLGHSPRAIPPQDGRIIDNDDVVSGIALLRKGANADDALAGIHAKVKELNERILPPGVKMVPFIDRSDLVHYTTHTVLHNLTEGIILVVVILFLFLSTVPLPLILTFTVPIALLLA